MYEIRRFGGSAVEELKNLRLIRSHTRDSSRGRLRLLPACLLIVTQAQVFGADCNQNSVEDVDDIAAGTSQDCNENKRPDECEFAPPELGPGAEVLGLEFRADFFFAADFDSNRAQDLVAIGERDDATVLAVFLGEESKTLAAQPLLKLEGLSLNRLVTGDFDMDGDTDLVGLTSSDLVVLEHLEAGRFAAPNLFPAPSFTNNLAIGDVTGDGRPDVVTTNRLRHHVAVHSRSPDGTLAEPNTFPVGGRLPALIALGDLGGDRALDVVTVNAQNRTISILTNLGDGSFGEPAVFAAGEGRAGSVQLADTDGDGTLEIIVGFEDRLGVFSSRAAELGASRSFDLRPLGVTLVDNEPDGDVDLFVVDAEADVEGTIPQGQIAFFTNLGNGTFSRGADILVEARLIAAGDWDGDGGFDLATVSDGPRRIELLFSGLPERIQFEPVLSLEPQMRPHQIALGDFNNDGLPDAVVANSNLLDHYTIAFNAGDGRFDPIRNYPYDGVTRSMATGDLDDDGDTDILLGDINVSLESGGAQLAVIENLGNQEFAPAVKHLVSPNSPHKVDLGDIDGDGDLDVLAASVIGAVLTMRNDGAANLSDLTEIPVGIGPYWGSTADFDGDGDLDYAITDRPGLAVFVLHNRGDGVFDGIERYPLAGSPRVLIHWDVDTDDDLDLVVANGKAISILRNDGQAKFSDAESIPVGREVYFVMALDFDADGISDIASTSDVADSVTVLIGRGGGEYAPPFHFPSGEGGRPGLAGDLDLDGDEDILIGNRPVNQLTAFLNPAANAALPGADFLETLCTPGDFHDLSIVSRSAPVRRALKFLTPAKDAPELLGTVYQHTRRFRLHQDFLAAVFPERFPSLSSEEYGDLVNRRALRQYYAGVLSLLQTPDGLLYGFNVLVDSSDPSELLTQEEVGQVYQDLLETFTLGPLGYFPQSNLEREVASTWEGTEFSVITETGPTGRYQPYTRGVAFGRVRVLDRAAFDELNARGQFSFQDILVLDHAPRDLEAVAAALITSETQTENSHTFIRLAIRNTPNAFVKDASEEFATYDRELVRFEVKNAEFTVRPAELEEAQAFWDANRPSLTKPPTLDATFGELLSLEDIAALELQGEDSLIARFGGKASNLARLQTVLDTPDYQEYQENGFAIPMRYYLEFMRSGSMPSALDAGRTVTYEDYLLELFTDDRFQTDSDFRFEVLDELRDHIRDEGVVDPDLIARVAVRIGEVMGTPSTTRVRFRSSSNIEDDVQFNGAGLYDSTSGCAGDDLDEDELGPSLCDPTRETERAIARALKRVWKSLWNFKAYEERAFFGIDQRLTAMAVLVNRTFIDEASNGVAFTGNVTNPQDRRFVITAQLGEESVVSPEPGVRAEKNLLTVFDGNVDKILRASLSTLVDAGTFVVSDEQLRELGGVMGHIDQNFPVQLGEFDRQQILLDMEFKFMPSGELAIKQVRPFLLNVPPLPTPEFELEIPINTAVCGTYVPFRSAAEAYSAKSTLRLAAGVFVLPTKNERFSGELIGEFRVGPEQELATPADPGTFQVERIAAGDDITSYVFSYSQPFSLADGTPLAVNGRVVFRGRGEEILGDDRLILDDAYFTTEPGSEGFGASLGGNLAVRYGSCGFETLEAVPIRADFADGTRLDLTERIGDEEDRTFFAAPAALTHARVTSSDGATRQVESYWQLVYAAENHNDPADYWIVFDAPQVFPDVNGEVFAVAFQAPPVFRQALDGRPGELIYLGADLAVLARTSLTRFGRGETPETLFRRGDVQGDGEINLVDPVSLLEWLFLAVAPAPPCLKAADSDDDGRLNITDAIIVLGQLFRDAPLIEPIACGTGRDSGLSCESSPGCN